MITRTPSRATTHRSRYFQGRRNPGLNLGRYPAMPTALATPAAEQYPLTDLDLQPTVEIRHAQVSDVEALHQLLRQPEVVYWTAELPYSSRAEIYDHLLKPTSGHSVLVATAGDTLVGMAGLTVYTNPRLRHVGRVGPVAVHPGWQGNGIGSKLMEAITDLGDRRLNLTRLELLVYSDNEAAIRLYEKGGFVTEGTLQKLAFRAGEYVNGDLMARVQAP